MEAKTLTELAGPGHTHGVLAYDGEVRSLRLASDRDRYTLLAEEETTLDCLLSADAAAIIQGGLDQPDEDEAIRVLSLLWEGEEAVLYVPDSW